MKRNTNSSYLYISNVNDPSSADYFCLNKITTVNGLYKSTLFNLTQTRYSAYQNVAINFVYYNPNQTLTSNFSLNNVYKLFGSFRLNVYTNFGGNVLNSQKRLVNVQQIDTYPFRSIQINQFQLDCSLNVLTLDCVIMINISNYANSFQKITIDYGNNIYDSFRINPYCKCKIYLLYIFKLK